MKKVKKTSISPILGILVKSLQNTQKWQKSRFLRIMSQIRGDKYL